MDVQTVIESLVDILTLSQRPCPNPSLIHDFVPDVSCIRRDSDGLCMQWQPDSPDRLLDGGDSAHRTGVLAFCNSSKDQGNLPKYLLPDGLMVRHPAQVPWNNPKNCSRDQLIGYLAGCWRAQLFDIAKVLYANTTSQRVPPFTCQNGDLLAPENLMFFRVCTRDFSAASDLVGQTELYISILALPTDPKTEINQTLLMAIVCGQLDVFVASHPFYEDQLRPYWGDDKTFRFQPCIADDLIQVVNLELARYDGISILDRLLPKNLWSAIKDINVEDAVRTLNIANPIWVAEMTARLAVAALKDIVAQITSIGQTATTLTDAEAELQGLLLDYAKKLVKDVKNYADGHLGPVGPIVAPALQAASGVLSLFTGSSGDDDEEESFRAEVRADLGIIIGNTSQIITDLNTLSANVAKLVADIKIFFADALKQQLINQLINLVDETRVIVQTYRDKPNDDDRLRILNAVSEGRQLIMDAITTGPARLPYPEALPYGLHAFTCIIQWLSEIPERQDEIQKTRDLFKEQFRTLYDTVPGGLKMQKLSLQQTIDDSINNFDGMLGKRVLAVRSTQQYKLELEDFGPRNPGGRAGEGGRIRKQIIVPVGAFDVQAYVVVFGGKIGDIASILAADIVSESWGSSNIPITADSDKSKNSPLSPNCIFDEVNVSNPNALASDGVQYTPAPTPAANAAVARDAQLKAMIQLSSGWSTATQSLRQVTALSLSTRSTFGF